MSQTTIDVNSAQCIVEKFHLGYSSFHNICTKAVTDIPWTGFEWIGYTMTGLLVAFCILMVFLFLGFLFS